MRRATRRRVLTGIATATCAASGCLGAGSRSSAVLTSQSAGMAVVDDGTAYFGTVEDVKAIDVETGDSVWTYRDAYQEIDRRPAVRDDAVFVGENAGGGVHAISAGEREWYFDDPVGDASRPVPSGDVVYVNAGGTLYELDRTDGQVRRERELRNSHPSTPVVRDDAVYLVTGGELLALDRSTLAVDWTHRVAGSSEVTARDGRLFASSFEHAGLAALDRHDGTLAWGTDLRHTQRAVVTEAGVYASERDGNRIGAYDLDGTKRWIGDSGGNVSPPAIGAEEVFVTDHDASELRAVEKDTGDTTWSFDVDAGLRLGPTNAPNRVFVPTDRGLLSIEK